MARYWELQQQSSAVQLQNGQGVRNGRGGRGNKGAAESRPEQEAGAGSASDHLLLPWIGGSGNKSDEVRPPTSR